jgi:hypothetical protein
MKRVKSLVFFLLAVCAVFTLINSSAYGQAESSDGWEFSVAPYAWIAGVTGHQTIGDNETSNENDLLDVLDFAFMLNFEARKNKWSLFSDINYVD